MYAVSVSHSYSALSSVSDAHGTDLDFGDLPFVVGMSECAFVFHCLCRFLAPAVGTTPTSPSRHRQARRGRALGNMCVAFTTRRTAHQSSEPLCASMTNAGQGLNRSQKGHDSANHDSTLIAWQPEVQPCQHAETPLPSINSRFLFQGEVFRADSLLLFCLSCFLAFVVDCLALRGLSFVASRTGLVRCF